MTNSKRTKKPIKPKTAKDSTNTKVHDLPEWKKSLMEWGGKKYLPEDFKDGGK